MAITEIKTVKNTSYNSNTNIRYVYETTYFYDDVLDKKFSKRKVVGKIDPDTGLEIATGPVGRPRKEVPSPQKHSDSDVIDVPRQTENNAEHTGNSTGYSLNDLQAFSSALSHLSDDFAKLKVIVDGMIRSAK